MPVDRIPLDEARKFLQDHRAFCDSLTSALAGEQPNGTTLSTRATSSGS